MAFVTDAAGGLRFPVGTKSARQSKATGIGFPTGVAIAGASVAAVVWIAGTFAAVHGVSLPTGAKFDSIALVSPQDRERFKNFEDARNFHPEKSGRLYPLMASNVVSHTERQYQIPPRESVASVNVPVLKLRGEMVAQAEKAAVAASTPAIADAMPVPTLTPAPTLAPAAAPSTQVASLDTAEKRFGLVMPDPQIDAPLPMARPAGWPKAPAPVADAAPKAKQEAPKQVLAYANPDINDNEDGLPRKTAIPHIQAGVAVYDITAKMVYLPDGTRMEAHSGIGEYRDNPRYVSLKGKGPTPPNTYKLSMRESLFHGVPAMRLTPADGIKKYGRDGLLAHTYLRRRPGDSAGCIVFKDYYKFLSYYKRGAINQVVVVESARDVPKKRSTLASLFGG